MWFGLLLGLLRIVVLDSPLKTRRIMLIGLVLFVLFLISGKVRWLGCRCRRWLIRDFGIKTYCFSRRVTRLGLLLLVDFTLLSRLMVRFLVLGLNGKLFGVVLLLRKSTTLVIILLSLIRRHPLRVRMKVVTLFTPRGALLSRRR